jgi:hypothetical protein
MIVLWDVAPMMEAVSISETFNFYHITQRNNTEDSHFHTRRRENLSSHLDIWQCRHLNVFMSDTTHISVVFEYLYVFSFIMNFEC